MPDFEFGDADRRAIYDLVEVTREAWAAGDGIAYASVCTDDARYVTASGRRLVGRQQIAAAHQQVFDTAMRGSQLELEQPIELQPLREGVALVHAVGAVRFPHGETPVRARGMLTMVAVTEGKTWRVASFSNTPIEETGSL